MLAAAQRWVSEYRRPAVMETTPNAAVTDMGGEGQQAFAAAATFDGARPGHVFKNGAHGLGYYRDGAMAADGRGATRPAVMDTET